MDNHEEVVVMSFALFRVLISLAARNLFYELAGLVLLSFSAFLMELMAATHGLQLFNPRQETSSGIYMGSILVPLVLVVRLINQIPDSGDYDIACSEFWSAFTSSIGLLVYIWHVLTFSRNSSTVSKLINSSRPWATLVMVAAFLIFLFPIKLTNAVFHIIVSTMIFQYEYHTFPGCASLGEALLVANGLAAYAGNAVVYTFPKFGYGILTTHSSSVISRKDTVAAMLQATLIGLSCVPCLYKLSSAFYVWMLSSVNASHAKANATAWEVCNAVFFYLSLAMAAVIATGWLHFVHGLKDNPVTWVLNYVCQDNANLCLCGYWAAILCTSVLPSYMIKSAKFEQILVRKVFHLMVVIMFIPALLIQPHFLKLAFVVALAGFLVIEMIRVYRIAPFGIAIHNFMTNFTDSRDSDVLIISHFSLLLGCALPLWLTSNKNDRPLTSFAGVLSLGIGDTMASVVGYNYGSYRISRSNKKTLEGTIAGILSMILACLGVQVFFLKPMVTSGELLSLIVAVLCTGLMEAYTTQLDNAFIPLLFYALLNV